jgi:patatin-like phospholipase/acyl hydrolase
MKKILNLDGGGVRVYLFLLILNYIEKKTNKKIVDCFDYFYSVSSGAIVLAGLLTNYSIDDMILLVKNTRSNNLHNMIDIFFNKMKLNDIKKPLGILTYDINTMKYITFHSYDNTNYNLSDVLKATTSLAPYYKEYNIDNYKLIDGYSYDIDLNIFASNDIVNYFGNDNYYQLYIGRIITNNMYDIIYKIYKTHNKIHMIEIDNNIVANDTNSFDTMDKIFDNWLNNNIEYIDKICLDLIK